MHGALWTTVGEVVPTAEDAAAESAEGVGHDDVAEGAAAKKKSGKKKCKRKSGGTRQREKTATGNDAHGGEDGGVL